MTLLMYIRRLNHKVVFPTTIYNFSKLSGFLFLYFRAQIRVHCRNAIMLIILKLSTKYKNIFVTVFLGFEILSKKLCILFLNLPQFLPMVRKAGADILAWFVVPVRHKIILPEKYIRYTKLVYRPSKA